MTWRDRVPDLCAGAGVAVLGILELVRAGGVVDLATLLVVAGFAAAVGIARWLPGTALAVVWATGFLQLASGAPVLFVELAVAFVAFACARWGSVAVVAISGLSIPGAMLVVVLAVTTDLLPSVISLAVDRGQAWQLADTAYRFGDTWQAGAAVVGTLALVAPWFLGLVLRFMERAQRSEASVEVAHAETVQAQEIARLREEQARLANDVHDVVGHSLAVILAQAESAQYLPDDPDKLKETMATIAQSARTSLQDVRQVLTDPEARSVRTAAFEELVGSVRATGQEVQVAEIGTPRPLPPELDVVAHRVVQEMLTNAVKHGRRDRPVHVERHWPQDVYERDLRLEVSNAMLESATSDETQPLRPATDATAGSGIAGMRRRVEAVGGRLDVRRRTGPDGPTFTATAWVPVRG